MDTMCDANAIIPVQPPVPDHFAAKFLEAFARTQAFASESLIETLRGLPFNNSVMSSYYMHCIICLVCFDGKSHDSEVLDAFINAIELHKECP